MSHEEPGFFLFCQFSFFFVTFVFGINLSIAEYD